MNGNFVEKQFICHACNIFKKSILRECLSSSIWYIEKLCVYNIFQQEENLAWFWKQNRYSSRCCIKGSSRNLYNTQASAKLINDILGKSVTCGTQKHHHHHHHKGINHHYHYHYKGIHHQHHHLIKEYIFADRFSSLLRWTLITFPKVWWSSRTLPLMMMMMKIMTINQSINIYFFFL